MSWPDDIWLVDMFISWLAYKIILVNPNCIYGETDPVVITKTIHRIFVLSIYGGSIKYGLCETYNKKQST